MCERSSGESCNKLARVTSVSHATQTCRGLDTSNAERSALRERPTPRLCFNLNGREFAPFSTSPSAFLRRMHVLHSTCPCLEISLHMRTRSVSFQHEENPSCKKFRFFCSITPAAHTSAAVRNHSGPKKRPQRF